MTPLQPKKFFTGIWKGDGELVPHRLFRPVFPKETTRMESIPHWFSDTVWVVKDRFDFSSGNVINRTMYCELIAKDRIHVTADDMPGGADIILHEKGFKFTPYGALAYNKGIRWKLRCYDENVIDENGVIHDTIRMYFMGFYVATMTLTVHRMEKQ